MVKITKSAGLAVLTCIAFVGSVSIFAQQSKSPVNDLPNPYQSTTGWAQMPVGRHWGAVGAVDLDPDGKSIWFAERCGSDSIRADYPIRGCAVSELPPVMKFNSDGIMVRSFGGGIFAVPHGIHVDQEGNVWITDAPFTLPPGVEGKGHQVVKFSPAGEVLLQLGIPGVTGNDRNHFNMPSDVITAPNGDIFVADGHGGDSNARIVKFSPDGEYLKEWGRFGTAPGEFDGPHGLAFDSQGRLFVADRGNNRIQIFDQEGNFIEQWYQFSRLSGIYIDANDILYGIDSESNDSRGRGEWKRGTRIGSARTGKVLYFIPDSYDANDGPFRISSGGEGIVADKDGIIYSAEVGPRAVKRFFRYKD